MPDDQKCTEADFQKWARVLAFTESFAKAESWGDHNVRGMALACGRWQMHPVFVDRWWPDDFETDDSTTWDDLFRACLRNFYFTLRTEAYDEVALAMWFHLHGGKGAGWDAPYATRFSHFWEADHA